MPRKSVEQIANEAEAKGKRGVTKRVRPKTSRAKQRGTKRLPVAGQVKRNRQIVLDRTVEGLTWMAVAQKHGIDEKTARTAYREHVKGVAPLIENDEPDEVALEAILKLQGAQERFLQFVSEGINESVKMGALREYVKALMQEMTLRQEVGLLPRDLGQIRLLVDQDTAADKLITLLKAHGMPPEVYDEVAAIFAPPVPMH
jgi:hypothetical protein